ncbi:hypothetical protein DPMN_140224 [Dreissena polymorpha]|uniref:Uncharacterized protein n=1 Tax=Dreissena polymorpha TaxID=45954 RepID=A0A9D4G774_DREPO|nr:hypothetical protein DPMN_140224 [Dreissena polymorpha]
MPPELLDEILERISQVISRQDTKYRSSLTPGLKLALTLRHLVEGKYFQVVPPLERRLQREGVAFVRRFLGGMFAHRVFRLKGKFPE